MQKINTSNQTFRVLESANIQNTNYWRRKYLNKGSNLQTNLVKIKPEITLPEVEQDYNAQELITKMKNKIDSIQQKLKRVISSKRDESEKHPTDTVTIMNNKIWDLKDGHSLFSSLNRTEIENNVPLNKYQSQDSNDVHKTSEIGSEYNNCKDTKSLCISTMPYSPTNIK